MKETDGQTISEQNEQLNLKPILNNETFCFSCYPGISCFNECCHEIDVILTPFDALRIKNEIGIPSDRFLAEYTQMQKLKDTEIPLVKLKMQDEADKKDHCVFLTGEGCLIYQNRPAVCRNYPTGVATQDPKEGDNHNPFFILEEDMCQGHREKKDWTVETWKKNQGVSELEDLNKPWLEIVAKLKNLSLKDEKDQKMNIFLMVCFDLDTFRKMVFQSSFLKRFKIEEKIIQLIENDEEELLKFGFQWLNFALFNEGPFKPTT